MNPKKSITDKLLANVSRRDEQANVELAALIVREQDGVAVQEVFANLANKKLQSDCIKILYEIAEKSPALVADYAERFVELSASKNNRIAWGAMTAIDAITPLRRDLVYGHLDRLRAIANAGSVITRDHFVNILITLAPKKPDVLGLLVEQFADCPPNQLPMYAERAVSCLSQLQAPEFVEILVARLHEMKTESKKKRVEKVIKKLREK